MTHGQAAKGAQDGSRPIRPPSAESSVEDQPNTDAAASRRYPAAPVVGVAAAVFRPQTSAATAGGSRGGEVLLVRRKHPPRIGEWGLPGGRLHLGEHTTAGVARELWEECRIEAELGGIVDTFEPIVYDAGGRVEYHYVVIEFWARYGNGQAEAGDDAAQVGWFAMDHLAELGLRGDTTRIIEKAYRAWQNAFLQNGIWHSE